VAHGASRIASAFAAVVLLAGCGKTSEIGSTNVDGAAKQHAYDEARDACSELGLDRVAAEYKSRRQRDAAARAYASEFLEPYRDSIFRGCRAGLAPLPPERVPCAQLKTRRAAHGLAAKVVDRVVAPDGQSERRTIGIIGESLYATCRQPKLPGVKKAEDYKPVKPVLREIQRDFDTDEIAGR
jgi:hypothetical protein